MHCPNLLCHYIGKFLDKVNDDKSPLLITLQNLTPVALMSLKEFNSYEETLYLLSSSKNAERLRRSIADEIRGKESLLLSTLLTFTFVFC